MPDATPLPQVSLPLVPLTREAFAPFGQLIEPRRVGGQFVRHDYRPEENPDEAQLLLTNGTPRLWIMHLGGPLLSFTTIARHQRVSQCLGAMGGAEWMLAVAAPGTVPSAETITAFRVPGDVVVKLAPGTWHAGPHFTSPECKFFNLENMDTNKADFEAHELDCEFRYAL